MNQKIENFPFRACGIENLQEFFTLHRGIILLECCLSEDAEAYNRLLQAVNRAAGSEIAVAGDQISELLLKSWPGQPGDRAKHEDD